MIQNETRVPFQVSKVRTKQLIKLPIKYQTYDISAKIKSLDILAKKTPKKTPPNVKELRE